MNGVKVQKITVSIANFTQKGVFKNGAIHCHYSGSRTSLFQRLIYAYNSR